MPEAVRVLLVAGANPDLRRNTFGETSLHVVMLGYAYYFYYVTDKATTVRSDINMQGWTLIITLMLKGGANPTAIDCRGNSPFHHLMREMFSFFRLQTPNHSTPTWSGDHLENRRQFFHEVVRIIQSYGGCAHTINHNGESAIDMCKDEDVKKTMRQGIQSTAVHFTLSGLAAAAVRKHQIKYHDKLPAKLIRNVELRD